MSSRLAVFLLAAFALLLIPSMSQTGHARSYEHCIRQGQGQWNGDRYETRLQNACGTPVRVHWCIRKDDDRLKCGVNPHFNPRAVTVAHANDAKRPVELLLEACEVGARCRVDIGD